MASRGLKWALLTLLLVLTFFLASFNATLRFIVDSRRELAAKESAKREQKDVERRQWKELARQKRKEREGAGQVEVVAEAQAAVEENPAEEEEEEVEDGGIDPNLAAMMGFSGFGGSRK